MPHPSHVPCCHRCPLQIGSLGSYAAAPEIAFGTIIQRITSWAGGVRMAYGHPDVWNKMETMTSVRSV